MKVGADRGEKLTKIKEEQFRGILGTVVPARNEKIGTYLCQQVRYESPFDDVYPHEKLKNPFGGGPRSGSDTFPPILKLVSPCRSESGA